MKKNCIRLAVALCISVSFLSFVPQIHADATANGQLSFQNLAITPSAGSFVLLTNWSPAAYAQATLSSQFSSSDPASASATGDFSTASGAASSTLPNAQSAANASILGTQNASDNASGQGWLNSWFEVTGGSGSVSATFSVNISGALSVLTDANGVMAQAETVLTLEMDGGMVLFDDRFFSIGPADSQSLTFSTNLTAQMTLDYNTPYQLYAQADSEVSVVNAPEPATDALLAAGAVMLAWRGRRTFFRRRKWVLSLVVLAGLGGVARATYIGGDAPDVCQTCGVQPTRQAGGTVSFSLTEGNVREDYPVTALQSSAGPTAQFSLVYNSYNADGSRAQIDCGLGLGWTHSYNLFLFQQRGSFFKMGPDGRITMYKLGAHNTYTADAGYFETISPRPGGGYIVTNKFQSWWRFGLIPNTPFLAGGPVFRLIQMGDRDGNVTTLSYSNGLLTQIEDTYGRAINLGYTNQHLSTITDPLGRTTQFQYDSRFRTPLRIIDPLGNVTRYTYNSSYQITRKVDRDGRAYFYLYRSLKPWAIMDGLGQTWFALTNNNNWSVDRFGLSYTLRRVYVPSTVASTDGNGNVWRYQYDTNGYISHVVAPDGSATSYVYDPLLRKVTAMTNALGAVTRYQYDALGNRTNVTDALGNTTTYTYDPIFSELTSMTDPNGRTTVYQYDASGNRTNEIDPLLQTQSWRYDSHGNVLSATDKDGNTTTYSYDSFGDRTNMTDALGHSTRYVYDAIGNMVSATDPLGHTTSYAYDGLNRTVAVTNAIGGVTTYAYDGDSRQTTNTDALGRMTTYEYDTRGRLVQVTDPLGGRTTLGYDANNNRIAATNQLGNPTLYLYDSLNRQTAEIDALGNATTHSYDAVGNVATNTDRNGNATSYTYDALNRRIAVTDPLGHITRYDYSTPGGPPCCSATLGSALVTRIQDANGHVTFYHYDELDRLSQVVRKQGNTNDVVTPNDAVTTYTYDPSGNRLAETDPVGNTTTHGYDALNRVIASTNAAGDVTFSLYDADGNVVSNTAPNGNVTVYTYDDLNRLTSGHDEVGLLATNTYDAVGNRLSATDADGDVTTYTYDGLNRRIATTDPMGQPSVTMYDAVGNVTTNVDRDGNATMYYYDAVNRHTGTVDALGNVTSYAYDAVGNVTNVMDGNGHITSYQYDALNRRIGETYPDPVPNTIAYIYDPVGNIVTRTDQKGQVTTYSYSELDYCTNRGYLPSGSSDRFSYDLSGRLLSANRNGWLDTFGYDGADRLVFSTQNGQLITYIYDIVGRRQTNAYPSGRIIAQATDGRDRLLTKHEGANPPIVTYAYDAADRLLTRTNGNGTATTYSYDADDRIISLETSNVLGRVVGFGYDYDFEGNRLDELKRHVPVDSEAYLYDPLNRLKDYRVGTLSGTTVPAPVLEKTWTLDPLANWLNVVSNAVTETRTHGPANELLSINALNFAYDTDGNLVQDADFNYAYDEENRLIQVQRQSDSAIVGRYFYDALGRRIMAIADPAGTSRTNVYFYDHTRLIEEQDGLGVPQATYVYGNYLDELLTMDRGGQTYFYHQNALWSPQALTDASGNAIERYAYDAYGGVIVLDGSYNPVALNAWGTPHSAVGNPYLYTGRELDEESGLYFFRARYFDPEKGRFLERDPLGYAGGLNLYEYVNGNPVNRTDPTGLLENVDLRSTVNWDLRTYTGGSWYWKEYEWTTVGWTKVTSKIQVTDTEVTHVDTDGSQSASNNYKERWSLTSVDILFDSSGGYTQIKCPCVKDGGGETKGLHLKHYHGLSLNDRLKLKKVSIEGAIEGGPAKAKIGVDIEYEKPKVFSIYVMQIDVCPNGRGGYTLTGKDNGWKVHQDDPEVKADASGIQ